MTEYLRSLRKAGIVDVNAAAQFMRRDAGGIDLNDRGAMREGDEELDEELAESQGAAFRLFLSHVVLEHGELWLSEDEMGIQAAALWLPCQPQQFGAEINQVFARELGQQRVGRVRTRVMPSGSNSAVSSNGAGTDNQAHVAIPELLNIANATAPDLILSDVALSDEVDPTSQDGIDLVQDLLRPVLASPVYSRFAALSLDPAIVDVLQGLGFRSIATVPISAAAVVWVGSADFAIHQV